MDKPESEMTAQELRTKANSIITESKKIPQGAVRAWIATTKEAVRLHALATEREKP